MEYATVDDLRARFGDREIDQLEQGRPGSVAAALADATALIDSVLYPFYGPIRTQSTEE